MNKLILGCGYLGQRVAAKWLDAGAEVYVVTRSPKRAAELRDQGFQTIIADVTQPESLAELPVTDTVLFSVGFDNTSGSDIESVYSDGMRHVVAALPAEHGPFIYISTTGVYGDAKGDWVDEQTPTNPQRAGGRASLAAEQILTNQRPRGAILLRLAGIYGPQRIPHLDKLRSGEPIEVPSEGWLNLIHVDDAAAIVVAADTWAKTAANGPHVFCVSDGQPTLRGEFFREIARRIGAAPPSFVDPNPSSPAAARAGADRRVSNKKMVASLRCELKYRSYLDGLANELHG